MQTSVESRYATHRTGYLDGMTAPVSASNPPDLLIRDRMKALSYQIFLSDPASATSEGVYFCGLKPYGSANGRYDPPEKLPAGFTTYRDAPGNTPFYSRAIRIIRLGLDLTLGSDAPLEAALCTNWYFQRAADTAQLKRFGLGRLDVSSFHQEMLQIYSPRLVLCAGNGPVSSYAGMLRLHRTTTELETNYLGNSRLRAATAGERVIVGVPHLSRYEITEELTDFIIRALHGLP